MMAHPDLDCARGTIRHGVEMAGLTWFRVGGPADRLFTPADEADLATYLARLPVDVPVAVVGVGSNLLVRDGGIRGVTIRLGRAFGRVETLPGDRIRAGAFALASRCAETAATAGIGGLSFLRGIPGTVGGALAMNAACYGGETARVLETAIGIDRQGRRRELTADGMGFGYRHCAIADGMVFVEAVLRGYRERPEVVRAEVDALIEKREASQPVRVRTGGSTFRNPGGRPGGDPDSGAPDESAWKLIEQAGCRGLRLGDAVVSEKHANFLVNCGTASAAEIEALGEMVRRRVRDQSGIELEWEIRRLGEGPAPDGGRNA